MKTITPELQSHLDGETTSIATCWRITRQDGQEFFFTDHDVALTVDGNLYKADSGYRRTAIANDGSLSVDNLDIEGIFDDDEITETDLRAGLFDFAQIRIFIVNWDDLSQGILRMRSGRMGEVNLTEQGVFRSELRGLTQQLSQRIGEVYTPECRADLGDSRCMIPIDPPVRLDSTAYEVGEYIRVPTGGTTTTPITTKFLAHLNDDTKDLNTNNPGALGANAALQGTVTKFGSGALEFSPIDQADTTAVATWPSNSDYDISGSSFAIEGFVRWKDLTISTQMMIARFNIATNEGWTFRRSFGNLQFFATTASTDVSLSIAFVPTLGQWYHMAATHDLSTNTFRFFIDGIEQVSQVNANATQDEAVDLTLGNRPVSSSSRPLDGFLDEWRITVGTPVYTSNFTPPTQEFPSEPGFLTHANTTGEDQFTGNLPTLGVNGSIQGTTVKYGAGAFQHSPPSAGANDTTAVARYPADPAYDFGSEDWCIEGYWNFDTTGAIQGLIAQFDGSDGWFIRYNSGFLEFNSVSGGGTDFVASFPASISISTWYHIAVSRDGTDIRIFLDGTLLGTDPSNAGAILQPADDLVIGGAGFSGTTRAFDGYSDEVRITIGEPVYTASFTPPTEEFPDPSSGGSVVNGQSVYENRIYRNTLAGTSAAAQPAYNTGVGATTVDGTAEFEAEQAWMRNGVVDTVTDRKTFTLTVEFDEVRAVDNWFNGGALQFESGDNDGRSIEIRDWTQSTREVTLFLPASFTIEPGTLVRLYPGCDKRLSTCRDRFNNVLNFRGEPHVPGQDQFTSYPDAKSG